MDMKILKSQGRPGKEVNCSSEAEWDPSDKGSGERKAGTEN